MSGKNKNDSRRPSRFRGFKRTPKGDDNVTPRTWLQFDERFKIGLQPAQLAWLNCQCHLQDLYFDEYESARAFFVARNTLFGLVGAMRNQREMESDSGEKDKTGHSENKEAILITGLAIGDILKALTQYTTMQRPETPRFQPQRLSVVVIGHSHSTAGFISTLTGWSSPCNGGVGDKDFGRWFAEDGRAWDFEVIDASKALGLGTDSADCASMEKLTAQFAKLGNIHAVLLLCNPQAPVVDEPLAKAIRVLCDQILTDAEHNFALVSSLWWDIFQDPESDQVLFEETESVINCNRPDPASVGLLPARSFLQEDGWISTLQPIHTKNFSQSARWQQQHIENIHFLQPWVNEFFQVAAIKDGTALELTRGRIRNQNSVTTQAHTVTYNNKTTLYLEFDPKIELRKQIISDIACASQKCTVQSVYDRLGYASVFLSDWTEETDGGIIRVITCCVLNHQLTSGTSLSSETLGAQALEDPLDVHTPRTWLQFNYTFKVDLRGRQLAWLNCRVSLHDLYYAEIAATEDRFSSREVLDALSAAIAQIDPRSDSEEKQKAKVSAAAAITKELSSSIISAATTFKKMPQPRDCVVQSEKVTIVLLGRTNVGKTSFVNALTGLGLDTSVKGRMTTQLELHHGKWFHADGRVWEFEVIDTPGIDDSDSQDSTTFDQLEKEFGKRGNIHAVFLVCNGQAPVLDLALLKAVQKYRDRIFGDFLLENWGLIYNKWFMTPEAIERRDPTAEDSLVDAAKRVFQSTDIDGPGTPLGITPSRFFFQDSLPDAKKPNFYEVRELFKRIDTLFEWVSSLKPTQTKISAKQYPL